MSETLTRAGLALGRLKTGTPARLDGHTIDWAGLDKQGPDEEPVPFSFMTSHITNQQIDCGVTRTTPESHKIIQDNIHLSAMYSGQIEGVGPRYCPSIEDKLFVLGSATAIRSSSNLKGSMITPYIRTVFQRRSLRMCKKRSFTPFRGLSASLFFNQATRSNTIMSIRVS